VDDLHDLGEDVGVHCWHDAVAEIEDVARMAVVEAKHIPSGLAGELGPGEHDRWVEVALQCLVMADPLASRVERDPPVDTDDVGADRTDLRQEYNPN